MKIFSYDGIEFDIIDNYITNDIDRQLSSSFLTILQRLILVFDDKSDDDIVDDRVLAKIYYMSIKYKWDKVLKCGSYLFFAIKSNT